MQQNTTSHEPSVDLDPLGSGRLPSGPVSDEANSPLVQTGLDGLESGQCSVSPRRKASPLSGDVFELAFLSKQELLEVQRQLWDMREAWRTLSPLQEFHTLGYSSYLDAATDTSRPYYYRGNSSTNLILRQRLPWLYRRLVERLEQCLSAPVRYRPHCAIPGFHIFLGRDGVAPHPCAIHTDRGFEYLRWDATENADFTRTISFTVAIQLPRSGAGLNIWPGDRAVGAPAPIPNRNNIERAVFMANYVNRPHHLHPYTEGTLMLHSGHTVHQMVVGERAPGDDRITLQGHGVHCNGTWQLYW